MGNLTFDKSSEAIHRPNGRLNLVNVPYSEYKRGNEGDIALSEEYGYVFSCNRWRRFNIFNVNEDSVPTKFNGNHVGEKNGYTCYDHDYFYIYFNGWRGTPLLSLKSSFVKKTLSVPLIKINDIKIMNGRVDVGHGGQDGSVSYDENYFYIMVGFMWRKIPLFNFE